MLVGDFMKLVYKSKKNGDLSKIAITFMGKHGLKGEDEKSEQELILVSQYLSNKDKRIEVIGILLEQINTATELSVGKWRVKNYKQVARELHPDSERGDTESFQFLQEIKWSRERMLVNGWVYESTIKAWIKKGEKPVFTNDYTEE
ncbi:MAG: hypothetical protein ACRCZ9_00185 [Fusobacteriaceae bacterium]